MTDDIGMDNDPEIVDAELKETVEALNRLPKEGTPSKDLWPGIQGRISAQAQPQPIAGTVLGATQTSWWNRSVSIPWAIAASLLLASAIGYGSWQAAQSSNSSTVVAGSETSGQSAVRTVGSDPVLDAVPDYDQAVTGLRAAYEAGKERLAPETIEVLEQSLVAIDAAIAEARAAIQADPARDEVRRMLRHNMNRKLDVLRQAAAAVQDRA